MQTKRTFLNRAGIASCAAVAILAISFNLLTIGSTMAESTIFNHTSFIASKAVETSSCRYIYLPTIFKNYPSPAPTPTPSIFKDRPDACYSPHGSVPLVCKIYSPGGKLYVMELDRTRSEFGVFNICNNQQLNTFIGTGDGNDLKGIAFSPSPDNDQVALMYHYTSGVHRIILMENLLNIPVRISLSFNSSPYHHYMVYVTDEYLAFSPTGSESDAIVYGIKNGKKCTLSEWRNNGEACP